MSRNMAIRQTRSGPESAESAADAESAEDAIISARAAADGANAARAVSLADEQAYVAVLYGLLDSARARSESALANATAQGMPGGTHQARRERDVPTTDP